MTYDNNNTGALFANTKKSSDKAPDYSGECEVNGVRMQIAGWRRTSKAGVAYLSLKFQPTAGRAPEKAAPAEKLPF